ncbi:hypothetical protein [Okeania sp. SIO1I7]|uniref:hypothetical protein n=1 Tax=Okeania sp. SIO1I7 TaxID=2607772 RepID=UPI0013F6C574|nr:hypothetical protein [Okeania sp. SIO1I7]NET28684.1 hypothetical protein [Okeania sp. SIO1I7]
MKNHVWKIGFLTGLILGLSNINKAVIVRSESIDTLAQSPDIAKSAQLTSSQLKQLVSVDRKTLEKEILKVIVPTYIPPGFKVDKLEIIDNDSVKSYKIIYRNSNNLCFYIADRILRRFIPPPPSLPLSQETVKVNSPFINETANLAITKYDRSSTNSSISLEFSKVDFESPCTEKDRAITTSEAVKIVESLQYLNP